MHTEHTALLSAVVESRHDLTPRLVYADFLDEYAELIAEGNDHCGTALDVRARAEFVRFQWSLAKLWPELGTLPLGESAPTHLKGAWQMVERCESLLARHRSAWLNEEFERSGSPGYLVVDDNYQNDEIQVQVYKSVNGGGGLVLHWRWHAGFMDCLSCSWALWDAIGDRVYAAWPVTRVEITGEKPHVHRVVTGGRVYGRFGSREAKSIPDRHQDRTLGLTARDDLSRKNLLATYWPGVTFTFQS